MLQVGNSGMFRPEMLRPMGLPEDVNVIAWGLGLERYATHAFSEVMPLLSAFKAKARQQGSNGKVASCMLPGQGICLQKGLRAMLA